MTPGFLNAVLEILLPGMDAGLPGGRAVGIDLAAEADTADPVLELIAAAAGGEAAFVAAPPSVQQAAVAAVETRFPQQFRRFLQPILADYCETPAVLAAFGGSTLPPQPGGRALPEIDAETRVALDRVRARGKLWRG